MKPTTDGWIAVGLLVLIGILAITLEVWWLVGICSLGIGGAAYGIGYSRAIHDILERRRTEAFLDHPAHGRGLRVIEGVDE